ncbi:MAG: hypothetical protein JWN32_2567 [Solirubrobacterales bacterium]|nr:hypothetical protein [Solirubrobacterales bacterium]
MSLSLPFPRIGRRAFGAAVAALFLLPAAGRADVTSSAVTSPTSPSFLTDDVDANTPLAVRGTFDATNSGDSVDLRCFGSSTMTFVNDIGSSGSFSTTGDLSSLVPTASTSPHMNVCRLRATPHGTTPSNLSPFAGPVVAVGRLSRGEFTFATGPNTNHLADTYFGAPQLSGANDYEGIGNCGLEDSFLVDPATLRQSRRLFFCSDWYSATDTWPGPSRSELQVDGRNVYPPGAIDGNFDNVDLSLSTGFPSFSFGPTRDPATGDVTINETDGLATCANGDPYPPSTANCPALAVAGVAVQRTITQDHAGRYVRIVDRFVSQDGAPHTLDALVENDLYARARSTDPIDQINGFRFPWVDGGSFHAHSVPDALPGAPAGPGTIYVKGDIGSADGDTSHALGTITYSNAPDSVRFTSPSSFLMGYRRTVPATGALTLTFTYSQGNRAAEVAGYASAAEDQAGSPVVTISNPVNGAVVGARSLNLRGFATDNGAVASFSVNGTPVALGAGGAWSLPVTLSLGTTTFTATATDRYGNQGATQVQVSYARCVVPNVRRQKQSSALKHLATAHCGGTVRRLYSSKVKRFHVISQSPRRGTVATLGRHVKLDVSRGPKPRHR